MNKLSVIPLSVVLQRAALQRIALECIIGLQRVDAVVQALAQAGFGIEATRVFAHALPQREAVWWACMCTIYTAPTGLSEVEHRPRELAEEWVRRQSSEMACAAMDAAKCAGFQSPEAWAGIGAFWSETSLNAAGRSSDILLQSHPTGVAVAAAVALASVRTDAARQSQRLAVFLQSAQDITAGGAGSLSSEDKCS